MNFKIMIGVAAILGLITVSVVAAAPIQAYINQTATGDVLKTQDQNRLRTRDCDCTCSDICGENPTRLCLHECASIGAVELEQ